MAVKVISPRAWAEQYKANADESSRNSMMDSGWSASVAQRCQDKQRILLFELYLQLKEITVEPSDLFDRPRLAAVLAAVHESVK